MSPNGAECPQTQSQPPVPPVPVIPPAPPSPDLPPNLPLESTTPPIPALPPSPPAPVPLIAPFSADSSDPASDLLATRTLSPLQLRAVSLLAEGHCDNEVARRLFLNRKTINRWRLYDPIFISRLNRARAALWANTLDQLRALLPTAVSTLAATLHAGTPAERQRAAIQLLKIAGTSRLAPRVGPDNLRDVLQERHREHLRHENPNYLSDYFDPPSDRQLNALYHSLLHHIHKEETLELGHPITPT